MTFKPENIQEFEKIFEKYHAEIRAAQGCKSLKLLQEEGNPQIFFTYSTWENADSLDGYRKSETFGVVWPLTKALFALPAEAWTVVEKYNL